MTSGQEAAFRGAVGIEGFRSVPTSARFVFEGDSITNPNLVANPTQTSWVPHALTLSNFKERAGAANVAVSGSTYLNMTARYASAVFPLRPTAGETVYLITMIGSNDGGTLPATWIAALESYWTTAKADGFTVVAITTPIHSANTNTLNFAAAVRASTVPDIIVNLGRVFRNSTDSALWLPDALHPTARGARLIAEEVNAALDRKAYSPGLVPLTVTSSGIGVGANNPRAQAHLVGGFSMVAGQNETPNTIRTMSIGIIPSVDPTAGNIPGLIGGRADSTTTILYLGRAAPSANVVCTSIEFWTAANNTTTGGSLRGRIESTGRVVFGSLSSGGTSSLFHLADANPQITGSATSGANSRQSWIVGRPAADGSLAIGALTGELVIAPESDRGLAFATVVGTTNFQIVRMRVRPSGNLSLTAEACPTFADDAAADAALQSGDLYRTTAGGRTVFRRP
jgi:lysophospholipase L1-like esterase